MMRLLLPILLLLPASSAFTASGRISVTVSDAEGQSRPLVLGVAPSATAGFDAALGEAPVPPVPPPALFDARILDPEGRKQYRNEAAWVDIRPFRSPSQRDTFHLACQTGALPLALAWDVPVGVCERLTLVDMATGERVDMLKRKRHESGAKGGAADLRFMVIMEGPRR